VADARPPATLFMGPSRFSVGLHRTMEAQHIVRLTKCSYNTKKESRGAVVFDSLG
jgi:hypothetical protein